MNQIFFFFFCGQCRASKRANTRNEQHGEQETRGAGEGSTKQCGTETLDLYKGEGWGGVAEVNKMDTTGTFRYFHCMEFHARNFKGVGLGWIKGGRKDRGFVWRKTRDGGEQLF